MRKIIVAAIAAIVIAGAAAGAYLLGSVQQQVYVLFPPQTNETYELSTAQGAFTVPSTSMQHFVTISNQSYYAMAEVKGNGLSLMMSPFMWNLAGANGSVNMVFKDERLEVSINLSDVTDISSIQVTGYPGLMYGKELWFPFGTATEQLKALTLPSKVTDLPNFYSVLNYSTYVNVGSIGDFSYDIWLTNNPNITSLGQQDIEVMIWMYSQSPELSQPFLNVGTVSAPTIINGTRVTAQYQVYVLPHTGSATGWAGVYFVLKYPSVGGMARGEVGVPIKTLLEDISSLLPKAGLTFYSPNTYYLNAIQVGMETYYSATNSLIAGYTLYSWKVIIRRRSIDLYAFMRLQRMKNLDKYALLATLLLLLASSSLVSGAAAPAYAFDGAYAVYQMSFTLSGLTGSLAYSGQVRYQISDVNAQQQTFLISVTFYGNLSEFYQNGTSTTATFSNPTGFPALNSSYIGMLNAGRLPPNTPSNVTDTTGVSMTVPAGKFVTDEVNFGEGNVEWFDQKTGMLVKEVGFLGPGEPLSFELVSTNVISRAPSYTPYEYLAALVAAAAVITALVAWIGSRRGSSTRTGEARAGSGADSGTSARAPELSDSENTPQ